MTKKELHQLISESIQLIAEKKLCPKGKAYYNRRIKAGEKPSAYLSGRAVKVCKGLMEGDEEMVHCENCGWEWKLADGGNDPFTCHKCGHNNSKGYNLKEAKQVGILYHYTTLESLKDIIESNQLIANDPDFSGIDNYDSELDPNIDKGNMVSFTRANPKNAQFSIAQYAEAVLVINGDKLSNNYKIEPTQQYGIGEDEMEERVYKDINNLNRYIIKIILYESDPDVESLLNEKNISYELNLNESLHDWFKKEDWVRIDTQGNITGPCGTMKKGKATTRCLPRAKANSLTKAERAATARKKANADRKGDRVVPNTDKAKVRLEMITPLMKEDINLQTIKNEDKGIQKAAGELNLPYDTIYTSFIKGKEVTLNDDMWSRLENTNSYNINSEGEAIELTRQYNENYQNVSFTEKPQHALILQYSPNKFYLIGGDDSLIFARAKGINPQVILATIEPTAKLAYQNVTGGIDEDCGCNDDDVDDYDVESEDDYEGFIMFMKEYARQLNESKLTEAEYHGRKVQLGKIMQGDIKKFKVYVKNNKGKTVKVNFGFGGKSAKGKRMVIKAKNPKRRAAYRARHNCSNPGPRWKANYWSCKKW